MPDIARFFYTSFAPRTYKNKNPKKKTEHTVSRRTDPSLGRQLNMGICDCSWFSISWATHGTQYLIRQLIRHVRALQLREHPRACSIQEQGRNFRNSHIAWTFIPRMRFINERPIAESLIRSPIGCVRNTMDQVIKLLIYNNIRCGERFTFYKIKIFYYWKVNLMLSPPLALPRVLESSYSRARARARVHTSRQLIENFVGV